MSPLKALFSNPDNKNSTILIVEDDSNMRLIIKQVLQVLGCKIIEAANGLEAQEICKKELPDLIALDLMMPKMGGLDFMKWFRAEYTKPYVPVLMLTALAEIEDKIHGFEVGADDYLVKPFNFQELLARVQVLLKIKILTNELYARNEQLQATQEALVNKERELVATQMAAAAAHNLGQPITSIALHCRLLEKNLDSVLNKKEDTLKLIEQSKKNIESIQKECKDIGEVVERLKQANPQAISSYVGDTKIVDI